MSNNDLNPRNAITNTENGSEVIDESDREPTTDPSPAKTSTEPHRRMCSAPMAVTSDGRLVINARDIEGRDVTGREFFTGVVLDPFETRFAMKLVDDAASGAAGHIGGRMPQGGGGSGMSA
jgi:hypothetical protein